MNQSIGLFTLNPNQTKVYNYISSLPTQNLHYVVIQQIISRQNFTEAELKKHIKRSVKEYVKRIDPKGYFEGKENKELKYLAIFESNKEFSLSQQKHNIKESDFLYTGLHFHLFITGVQEDYLQELLYHFKAQKNKANCIKQADISRKTKLDFDFIAYHLKQMKDSYSPQQVLKNWEG
jgi:hypothetical protein